jgi:glycosyltransferase involved in cell wall biosynthesis
MSQEQALRVGVYKPANIPQSFKVYTLNVQKHLTALGLAFVEFGGPSDLPREVDLLWDIRSGGGNAPPDFLLEAAICPLVVTIHGFAPVSLPAREYSRSLRNIFHTPWDNWTRKQAWKRARPAITGVIAVSEFTKQETVRLAGIPPERISVCHHGVDSALFSGRSPKPRPPTAPSYFLHVSNDEPRKNIARIVRAFKRLRERAPPVELVLKLPTEAAPRYSGIEGVRVVSGHLETRELADLYADALGFVFPSLYEGFGLPILEAMASGCPVITSNVTACPEAAGEAAILVDPRDDQDILRALTALRGSQAMRADYATAGLARARQFTWESCAACHARAFSQALG